MGLSESAGKQESDVGKGLVLELMQASQSSSVDGFVNWTKVPIFQSLSFLLCRLLLVLKSRHRHTFPFSTC